jgi:drug/metabolite transporter (DMT)-like permease
MPPTPPAGPRPQPPPLPPTTARPIRQTIPRLQLLAAAALFSTGGAAVKAVHFAGWPVACLRSGIAAAALLLLVPQARRRPSWRILGVAACYATTMILFVLANKLTSAASTIFLQATAPLFVLLLSPWLLGERIRRGDLLSIAAIGCGLVLLVAGLEPATATAPEPLRGNVLAAITGLTWALTIMGLRSLGRTAAPGGAPGASVAGRTSEASGATLPAGDPAALGAPEPADPAAAVASFWGNVLAFGIALPFSLPLPASRPTDWALLAFLGLFQIAFAYLLLSRGIGGVPALEASFLLMLEPVLNPLWAWLVHGERPGPRVLAGGALILAATLFHSWLESRRAGARDAMRTSSSVS